MFFDCDDHDGMPDLSCDDWLENLSGRKHSCGLLSDCMLLSDDTFDSPDSGVQFEHSYSVANVDVKQEPDYGMHTFLCNLLFSVTKHKIMHRICINSIYFVLI